MNLFELIIAQCFYNRHCFPEVFYKLLQLLDSCTWIRQVPLTLQRSFSELFSKLADHCNIYVSEWLVLPLASVLLPVVQGKPEFVDVISLTFGFVNVGELRSLIHIKSLLVLLNILLRDHQLLHD
jgi:hypothetical protein